MDIGDIVILQLENNAKVPAIVTKDNGDGTFDLDIFASENDRKYKLGGNQKLERIKSDPVTKRPMTIHAKPVI